MKYATMKFLNHKFFVFLFYFKYKYIKIYEYIYKFFFILVFSNGGLLQREREEFFFLEKFF